jgi:hypothetical protein
MNPPRTLAQEADHQCIGLRPVLECILTPSRDLTYIEGAAPINPTCVQLLHHPAAEHARAQEARARQTQQRWNKQWPITEPCQR